MNSELQFSWQSPFDETDADLPVDLTEATLGKIKNGAELTFDEQGLVDAAFLHRPDLIINAGLEEGARHA